MTLIPLRAAVWRWLGIAPAPVVLSICLATSGTLAGWVWLLAGEVRDQQATVAVAAEKSQAAKQSQTEAEARLVRLEAKLDQLLIAVANLSAESLSTQPPRPRRVVGDTEKTR